MRILKGISTAMAIAALCVGLSTSANAAWFSAYGVNPEGGNTLSAKAGFEIVGGQLQVTLINTGPAATRNSDVLTALYFTWDALTIAPDTSGGISTPGYTGGYTDATLPIGNQGRQQTLGGGWAYDTSGNGATGLSPLNLWGNSSAYWDPYGANQGPNAGVDGVNYGIVSSLAASYNPNAPLTTDRVIFLFDITGTVDWSKLTFGGFQYGTSASEPHIVPEPTTMIAGALLLLPFAASTMRLVRKNRKA